jgi:SAM-dependent methyltransferase
MVGTTTHSNPGGDRAWGFYPAVGCGSQAPGGSSHPGSWLARAASERIRLARLGRAFEELRIDVRGKRILGSAQALEDSGGTSFDVIVSSFDDDTNSSDPALFSTLKDRLEPGGVLCVFVRTNDDAPDSAREHLAWSVAGSIAHAGLSVVFAEGSRQLDDGTHGAARPLRVLSLAAGALRSALSFFTPRAVRERVSRWVGRFDVRPRHALVVARRGFV